MGCQKSKPVASPEPLKEQVGREEASPSPKAGPLTSAAVAPVEVVVAEEDGEGGRGIPPTPENVPPVHFASMMTPRTASTTPGSGSPPGQAEGARPVAFRGVLGQKKMEGMPAALPGFGREPLTGFLGEPLGSGRLAYDFESDTFCGSVGEEASPLPLPPAPPPSHAELTPPWQGGETLGPGAEELPMPQIHLPRLLGRAQPPGQAEATDLKLETMGKQNLRKFPYAELPQRTLTPIRQRPGHGFDPHLLYTRQQCFEIWGCAEQCAGVRRKL